MFALDPTARRVLVVYPDEGPTGIHIFRSILPGATIMGNAVLERLYAERKDQIEFVDRTLEGTTNAEGQTRDLSDSEQESLTRAQDRITELDKQIKPLEAFEQLRSAGQNVNHNFRPTAPANPSDQPGTGLGAQVNTRAWQYGSAGHVIVDQLRAAGYGGPHDSGARDRLISAGVVYPDAPAEDVRAAGERAQELHTETRATSVTGDSPGVLPEPIIGEIMSDIDAARPFITSIGPKPMDFAGETFSRPVIGQHTAAGQQTTQATSTGVGSQKLIINGVPFTKETWGGYLDVARQQIDWTSPSAWNAILTDLQEQYGIQTEGAAAGAFAGAITQQVELEGDTLQNWLEALYAAAALAYTGSGRLPNGVWLSLDMWSTVGPVIDASVATNKVSGTSSATNFQGMLVDVPRIVVPSFPASTVIIGASRWTEVYEERLGLLQAVQPAVFGVQVAYGGYVAYETLKADAFAAVVDLV